MTIDEAQADIRRAYVGGGPGVFVSAIVWFVAFLVERQHGIVNAFATLFVGGMTIFPVATLASRFVFGRPKEAGDNPLARTALESTIAMIAGLFSAWLLLPFRPDYTIPLAAIAVGTHYLVFKTVYGDRLFWLLGTAVTVVGFLAIYPVVPLPGGPILAVGVVELIFAALLTARGLRSQR